MPVLVFYQILFNVRPFFKTFDVTLKVEHRCDRVMFGVPASQRCSTLSIGFSLTAEFQMFFKNLKFNTRSHKSGHGTLMMASECLFWCFYQILFNVHPLFKTFDVTLKYILGSEKTTCDFSKVWKRNKKPYFSAEGHSFETLFCSN